MRPTTEVSADIEFQVLTTTEGRALLDEVNGVATPGPREVQRWRRRFSAEIVHAAIGLSETRRRGAAKFSRSDRMWFDRVGLEQATSEIVARQKARRFVGGDVVDLCSGIGGDSIAMAAEARSVVAVDRDHGMLRRALWNAEVHGVRSRIMAVRASAETFALRSSNLVHVDPDRRASSERRSRSVASYAPGVDFLRDLPDRCRGGAIKLSPASDFEHLLRDRSHEVEIVSLAGECKEATVWFGDRATCLRRATTLPSGATWTDRDGEGDCPVLSLSAWIYDLDPALRHAGLLDGFASSVGLSRFEPGIDLLTSADRLESPWVSSFEVLDVVPFDLKILKAAIRSHDFGDLEIKPRGVDVSPESLRKQLDAQGSRPGTVFPIRGQEQRIAILARRV